MKNHTDAAVRRRVVTTVLAALAAVTAPTASAAAGQTHSPPGSCVRASLLAFRDRHAISTPARLVAAVDAALAHRHAPCAALADYLEQSAA